MVFICSQNRLASSFHLVGRTARKAPENPAGTRPLATRPNGKMVIVQLEAKGGVGRTSGADWPMLMKAAR